MNYSSRKKNLLSEDINRVREIMGLLPINEAIDPFKPFFKLLRNVARKVLNPQEVEVITQQGIRKIEYKIAGRNVAEDVYKMYSKLLNTDGDEFKAAYQAFVKKIGNETDEAYKARLRNLIQVLGDDYSIELYKEFFKSWFKKTGDMFGNALKSEKAFYKWMSKAKQRKIASGDEWDIAKWLKDEVRLLDDELDLEALVPQMEKRLKEFEESPVNFKTKVVKKATGKVVPLSQDRINYLKNFLGRRASLFSTVFRNWGKTLEEYEQAVLGYMEAYADDVIKATQGGASKEELQTLSAAYAQQVSLILRKAKLKFGDEAISILEDSGLPDDIIAHFRNNQDDFFKYFNEAFSGLESSVRVTMGDTFMSSMRNFVNGIAKFLLDLFTLKIGKVLKNLLNPETNLGTWFWTKSWAGFDTMYQVASKNAILSKNPRWLKFFAEASLWTTVASISGYFLQIGWEVFKELVIKGISQNIIVPICYMISDIIPSMRYSTDPVTGEGKEGPCIKLDKMSQYEQEGWNALLLAVPNAAYEAWNESVERLGYKGIALHGVPILSQIIGFFERLPYSLGAFRQDIKPLHDESKESQDNLKKETKEETNGEINLDNIQLPNSDTIELELTN